jgi:hypothetical protein
VIATIVLGVSFILSDFNKTAIYLAEANGYRCSCLPEGYAEFKRSSLRGGTDF